MWSTVNHECVTQPDSLNACLSLSTGADIMLSDSARFLPNDGVIERIFEAGLFSISETPFRFYWNSFINFENYSNRHPILIS